MRNHLLLGSGICLLLGAADLGALNLWLAPRVWPVRPPVVVAVQDEDVGRVEAVSGSSERPVPSGMASTGPSSEQQVLPDVTDLDLLPPNFGSGALVPPASAAAEPAPPGATDVDLVPPDFASKDLIPPDFAAADPVVPGLAGSSGSDSDRSVPDALVVRFDSGSAALSPQARSSLAELLRTLEGRAVKLAIEGHADSTGPADLNQRLSERRAAQVARFLRSRTDDRVKIRSVGGFGDSRPEIPGVGSEARAKNRRVVVRLDVVE